MSRSKKIELDFDRDEDGKPLAKRTAREMEIDEVLGSIAADENATLLIKRESKDFPGQMERIGTFSPAGFDVEKLRREWGGGKYTVQVKNAKTGIYGASKVFVLANVAVGVSSGPNGGLFGGANQQFMETLLLKLIAPPPAPPDLTPLVIALAGVFKPTVDPMDMATKLAALLKPSDGGGAVDALLKGVDLANKLAGDDAEPTMLNVVKEMGPPIVDLLGKVASRMVPPAPAAVPDAALPAPAPAAAPALGAPVTNYIDALRALVPRLMQWAEQDKDPVLRAQVVLEDIPPWVQRIVETESHDPQFETKILTSFPELRPYQGWMMEFLQAVREYYAPDEPAAPGAVPGSVSHDGVDDD